MSKNISNTSGSKSLGRTQGRQDTNGLPNTPRTKVTQVTPRFEAALGVTPHISNDGSRKVSIFYMHRKDERKSYIINAIIARKTNAIAMVPEG